MASDPKPVGAALIIRRYSDEGAMNEASAASLPKKRQTMPAAANRRFTTSPPQAVKTKPHFMFLALFGAIAQLDGVNRAN